MLEGSATGRQRLQLWIRIWWRLGRGNRGFGERRGVSCRGQQKRRQTREEVRRGVWHRQGAS
ncbi:hypothetical protein IEQ34_000573 [Dendrobium chrysotoxum]|uniref:Uncharacterized protein n=1 Tax=Dendrobium chrysotoxum TaxID=161865 RepID=A0AAV7H9E0_DENCH|nr:hypothetical protein IEQ34_000573 [Dendrobium chrysotoxum]